MNFIKMTYIIKKTEIRIEYKSNSISMKTICMVCKTEVKRDGKGICSSCEDTIYNGPPKAFLEREKAAKEAHHTRYYQNF
jgi:hypothetical protein